MKNKKPFVREVILVEGKYDKNTLSQIVDAAIVTTDGFSVFQDREKLAFFRRLAAQRGLIVLTDSDGAGFLIRNFLKGAIPKEQLKQAYVPDVYGKERRKRRPGKEGKLGVEGMTAEVLLDALRQAGATMDGAAAEFFLRTRHIYADSDLGRLRMQRYFYAALFARMRSMTVWDIAKLLPVITYSVQLFGKLNDQRIYQETIETHRQVVDAIAAHDPNAARECMYRHLSGNLASITEQEQLQMKEKKTRRPAKAKL